MWVNRALFERTLTDNMNKMNEIAVLNYDRVKLESAVTEMRTQKAKDDMTIDWMRHQVNALSKQNSIMMAKVAGVHFPVPEIVPTRPGTLTIPDFSSMPSFEDCGPDEAVRLGIEHDAEGQLVYTK
jgi:hypothetical protein